MNKVFSGLAVSLLIIISVILLCGCGKKSNGNDDDDMPPAESFISFKANGVQKKYTSQALISMGHSDQTGLFNGVLQGYKQNVGVSDEHIGIIIFSNNAIENKTYQDPEKVRNNNGDDIAVLTLNYVDDAGRGYISMGPIVDKDGNITPFPGSQNIIADGKVTITKVTASSVEGTFSGTTFLSTDPTYSNKVSITEGKFSLKRLQ